MKQGDGEITMLDFPQFMKDNFPGVTCTRNTGTARVTRTRCSARFGSCWPAGFKGNFALEYEAGPLNGVEGATYLYKEVAALTTPAA
jgi:hypothetical protein